MENFCALNVGFIANLHEKWNDAVLWSAHTIIGEHYGCGTIFTKTYGNDNVSYIEVLIQDLIHSHFPSLFGWLIKREIHQDNNRPQRRLPLRPKHA